jgi:uncharacterized protein (DUF1501 family)
MLTITSGNGPRDCRGVSRRDFLRVGSLGLAGLTLPELLAARAAEASFVRDRSVVFLFLNGGPSQFETFDPKMTAPAEFRSVTGEVQTKLPGVTFGGTFPKLGALADQLAVVRSFKPGNANHDGGNSILSCQNPTKAALGALYARLAGSGNPRTGLPSNVLLTPMSVGRAPFGINPTGAGGQGFQGAYQTGNLPSSFQPFHPTIGAGNDQQRADIPGARKKADTPEPASGLLSDMKLRLPAGNLDDRLALLKQLDGLKRGFDGGAFEDLDKYQQQAYQVLLSGVSKAFDLSNEDAAVLRRYDTSDHQTPADLGKKLPQTLSHTPVQFGKQMLLARRLVEAGVGFVTVGITGWDMHGNNGFGISDGFSTLGPAVDHALAAFVQDLAERGLSDKVLLVVAGEMGRTPKINPGRAAAMEKSIVRPGRDHWANLGALLLAGGGLKMGQVVGQSDRIGGSPATAPVTPNHLLATIMHVLFDIGQVRVQANLPADIVRLLTESPPIVELVG